MHIWISQIQQQFEFSSWKAQLICRHLRFPFNYAVNHRLANMTWRIKSLVQTSILSRSFISASHSFCTHVVQLDCPTQRNKVFQTIECHFEHTSSKQQQLQKSRHLRHRHSYHQNLILLITEWIMFNVSCSSMNSSIKDPTHSLRKGKYVVKVLVNLKLITWVYNCNFSRTLIWFKEWDDSRHLLSKARMDQVSVDRKSWNSCFSEGNIRHESPVIE